MSYRLKVGCIVFLLPFFANLKGYSQDITNNTFGKGIKTIAKDSSFLMKFSMRFQNRYDGTYIDRDSERYSDKIYLRRSRLKFDGFVFTPKVVYKVEYDVVSNQMLDAVIKWNFYGNLSVWYGQTKLPGNVERVISSQKLQFVDRSLLNAKFNIDRDKGLQLRHHFTLGKMLIREKAAVSQGEGKNYDKKEDNVGNDYSGRIEILPFGAFTSKGDYFSSDLKREKTPKLMLSASYDYNDEALKPQGQLGNDLSERRDLQSVFVDLVFKYRGISVLSEYANKKVSEETPVIFDEDGNFEASFTTGEGYNAQFGYLFKNNVELAYRFTEIKPERVTLNNNITQHTMGFSRYFVGHSLKIQSDLSYTQEASTEDTWVYRFQVELAF